MKTEKEIYYESLLWIPVHVARTTKFDGLDKKELEQELKITVWCSMNQYLKLKKGGRKLGSLQKYVHRSCLNKRVSYIRSHLALKNSMKVSLEGLENHPLKQGMAITVKHNKIVIDGKDILRHIPDVESRRVFYLSIVGYSYKEISGKVDIPVSMVRNIIFSVRQRLRYLFFKETLPSL